jgi:hypothetical protein
MAAIASKAAGVMAMRLIGAAANVIEVAGAQCCQPALKATERSRVS